jgi:hypothetical protein
MDQKRPARPPFRKQTPLVAKRTSYVLERCQWIKSFAIIDRGLDVPHDTRSKSNGRDLRREDVSAITRPLVELQSIPTDQFELPYKLLRFTHALRGN